LQCRTCGADIEKGASTCPHCRAPIPGALSAPLSPRSIVKSWLALLRGQILANRFEVQALLEEGPLGAVFRGADRESGVNVAIKVMRSELVPRLPDGDVFLSGCERASRIVHAHLIRVLAADLAGGFPFFAMQLAGGLPLRRIMDARREEGRPFSAEEVVPLVNQIAHGLEATVSFFPGHGLLKPENVLVLPDSVKVTDYPLVSSLPRAELFGAERRGGGLGYAAPELLAEGQLTPAADVYSLALIAAELLTGRRLQPREISELHGAGALGRLIALGLSPDPKGRTATPVGFARALPYTLDGPLARGDSVAVWAPSTVEETVPREQRVFPAPVAREALEMPESPAAGAFGIEGAVQSYVTSRARISPPAPEQPRTRLTPATQAPRLVTPEAGLLGQRVQRVPVLLWVLVGLALLWGVLNGILWLGERARDEERRALWVELKEERKRLAVERELLEELRRALAAQGKLGAAAPDRAGNSPAPASDGGGTPPRILKRPQGPRAGPP
jgi:hypothetical protein